jgi:hypothetical protein
MSMWAFDGARDDIVPLAKNGQLVDAIRAAGVARD